MSLFLYFTILYLFCHTSTWIHHECTRVPHPDPPAHLLPHTIPLRFISSPLELQIEKTWTIWLLSWRLGLKKSLFGIDDSFQITYTHITYCVCVCVCVCVLAWLEISWIWSLFREILLISSLQSHYLNRWRSYKFWKELCYLFSYKFVPADLSLKFWFSSFSHISSWKTWFPWVYLLSTGEMVRSGPGRKESNQHMISKLWPTWTDCWG